ncbi:CHAT domain-containing protein [Acaryochloris sp. IP29b_bin.148]|uniref:CHAT domain-containing protein n=1 Tax=Acaryochloris sp. IP29b_bin.148 TaxID=2969218 RepID=UPI002612A03F|nr:CHAT domain-containing protein [Acaryochloris sp. IP29b_bin.148]
MGCIIANPPFSSASPQLIALTQDADATNAPQQAKQGALHYQSGDYRRAIESWTSALALYQKQNDLDNAALMQENLARAYQQTGQFDLALNTWQQTVAFYRQRDDRTKIGRLQTEQAQTYSQLGQHRQAIALLCTPEPSANDCVADSALGIARSLKDTEGEVAALGSLGNAHRLRGNYKTAITWFEKGLAIAQTLDNPSYQAATLNNLGNAHISRALLKYRRAQSLQAIGENDEANTLTIEARTDDQAGLQYFQTSLSMPTNEPLNQLRALLNVIPLHYRANENTLGIEAHQQARQILPTLPNSRNKVFAAINLANLIQPEPQSDLLFSQTFCPSEDYDPQVKTLLNEAITIAQSLSDRRSESFALGKLGHLYECRQAYAQALDLTQKARWAAEDLNMADSLYLWEWQTGRILNKSGQDQAAIAAYEQAIATLDGIRTDIVVADRDLQFDFRDTVEPLYRELAQLRLDTEQFPRLTAARDRKGTIPKDNIAKVLSTVDALKLAELQNYFGDECAITALPEVTVEQISQDQATAVISTLMLGDRTAVILTLPDRQRQIHWIEVPDMALRQAANHYRSGLENQSDSYDSQPAQKLYDWLIRPFEGVLQSQDIETLVFVQDGIFRSIPMAALHDGQQFLIQKYAVATTPFFNLTTPPTLTRNNFKTLALGLTEEATINQQDYPALAYVNEEISNIQALFPKTQSLLNQKFTRDRLQQELQTDTYSIVHIATHAEFGPEPQDTFLITGNNEVLSIEELDTLLRSTSNAREPIELLMLTACETAVGDDRAALGLAGVALQAGAKSAVASLWPIYDQATARLVEQFYRELLKPNTTKATALQKAQLTLLVTDEQSSHPAFWAPFILIGNWT